MENFGISFGSVYDIDYDCDYQYNCEAEGCDSICRCGKIKNLTIINLNFGLKDLHINKFYKDKANRKRSKPYNKTPIESYCFDRLMRIYKTYDKSLYKLLIGYSYYGEEVYDFQFENMDSFCNSVKKVLSLDDEVDKIKYILNEEYSYILDSIKDVESVSIENVNLNKICLNNDYSMRLKKDAGQNNYNFEPEVPVGVLLKSGNDYRLIDGYHRFTTLKSLNQSQASYIVLHCAN